MIYKKNKFKFKHSLGQNFIIDEFLLDDIADESGITRNDFVLEIGPGNGALTRCLCERAKFVVAIEIDKSLITLLKNNLKDYTNVSIINADFLNYDFKNILFEFQNHIKELYHNSNIKLNSNNAQNNNNLFDSIPFYSIKVVSNLPYYITSPIIHQLLENPYICEMTLMVQKEVAERIVALPNNKNYGVLTLACNYFSDTKMIMVVSKNCFFPKPKVDSAVVHFKKNKVDVSINNAKLNNNIFLSNYTKKTNDNYIKLFKLIKASFSQRRKKLLNSLTNAGYNKDKINNAFLKLKFNENIRAENLSLNDFQNLLCYL